MELYAVAPERFGDFRPGPIPPPKQLNEAQLRGEFVLQVLRYILIGAMVITLFGLVAIVVNVF